VVDPSSGAFVPFSPMAPAPAAFTWWPFVVMAVRDLDNNGIDELVTSIGVGHPYVEADNDNRGREGLGSMKGV
jgi:hypothetical protein